MVVPWNWNGDPPPPINTHAVAELRPPAPPFTPNDYCKKAKASRKQWNLCFQSVYLANTDLHRTWRSLLYAPWTSKCFNWAHPCTPNTNRFTSCSVRWLVAPPHTTGAQNIDCEQRQILNIGRDIYIVHFLAPWDQYGSVSKDYFEVLLF